MLRPALIRTLALAGFSGILLAWKLATPTPSVLVTVQRPLMGTVWTIEAAAPQNPLQLNLAIDAAFAELARIDQMMSEWKPTSPISQVNSSAGRAPVEVPEELRDLLLRSQQYTTMSEGTFDVTWRGMGRIWRFDDEFHIPSVREVEAARRRIDASKIQVRTNGNVYLPEGMNIGLGGIAKGYAVDRAMQILEDHGIHDALVNGGGDILVRGTRLGQPWTLGVQHPRRERGVLLGSLQLRNQALLTSGDYERFRIAGGVRYHHIIDPRTGWPATASTSVTILAPSAELGVVLAKAVFILGPDKGMRLARDRGVEALLIDPQGKEYRTPGFPPLR